MTWPLPQPTDIAARYASAFEAQFSDPADGEPPDARTPNSVMGVLGNTSAEALFELYLYQRSLAEELMPDTAQDYLARHGDIWGVPQIAATFAIGNVLLTATPGADIPAGVLFSDSSGAQWVSTAQVTVPAGGVATIPVQATVAGAAGDVAAGASLALVSPLNGVAVQSAVVDPSGLAGGADAESLDAWRARILLRIRTPGAGGSAHDYVRWAKAAGAAYVGVVPGWVGAGSVGVIVAMAGPAAATPAQVAAIQAYINNLAPVTANVVVLAATLQAVPVTLWVSPDTVAVQAAAQQALALFFSQNAEIGGTITYSGLDGAITTGSGDVEQFISVPAADVTVAATQLPVLGAVTFVAPPPAPAVPPPVTT